MPMAKFWRSYEPSLSIDKSQVDADPAWRGCSNRGRLLGNHGAGERSTRTSGGAEQPTRRSLPRYRGVGLHYLERGAGPPLVLLHGNGAMVQSFEISGI